MAGPSTIDDGSELDALELFRGVTGSVMVANELPTEEAKFCLEIATKFKEVFKDPSAEGISFAKHLVFQLKLILEKRNNLNKEKMWVEFHKLRSSQSFEDRWKTFLDSVKLQNEPLFYQHFTQEVFEKLIEVKLKPASVAVCDHETPIPRLTSDEENAVCYIGGYVVRKIRDALKSPQDKPVLTVLSQLITSPETKETSCSTSQEWTHRISRGGLINITDQAFQCFYSIEYCIRRYLRVDKISEMDNTFRAKLENLVTSDDDVQFSWCLIGPMEEKAGRKCLDLIIQKWVTIRGFSFANSIVELYKQENKKGTGKSKGLRTKLFTD